MSKFKCLQDLLRERAETETPSRLLIYFPGNVTEPKETSYYSLYSQVRQTSLIIQRLGTFKQTSLVLRHLDDQWDTIHWFWAVLFANGIPVLSSPFFNVEDHRRKHIQGLSTLLGSLICITRSNSLHLFGNDHGMQPFATESIFDNTVSPSPKVVAKDDSGTGNREHLDQTNTGALSMIMLASGSTGNPKAARLTHDQVLASIAGKSSVRFLPSDKPFLY
jgi:acyl-CoA synthetase (AMP-forming)/AMP-acid ligase II